MPELKEISELEQAYHQLDQIKRQVNALSDFLASKLRDKHDHKPKTRGMLDPRTGKPFRQKAKSAAGKVWAKFFEQHIVFLLGSKR